MPLTTADVPDASKKPAPTPVQAPPVVEPESEPQPPALAKASTSGHPDVVFLLANRYAHMSHNQPNAKAAIAEIDAQLAALGYTYE